MAAVQDAYTNQGANIVSMSFGGAEFTNEISAQADIGHVNLTVSDLERAVVFYRDVIGLRVTQRDEDSAFLAAGAYHHHVALNRWDEWPRKPDGSIAMTVAPLDVEALVADAF